MHGLKRQSRWPKLTARTAGLGAALGLWFNATNAEAAQQLACGQSVTNTIAAASQTATYTFSAGAGEVVLLSVFGQPGTPLYFDAVADVYDPSVQPIFSVTNGAVTRTLGITGKYTVVVHAGNYANVGRYGISLVFVTGRCGIAPSPGPITGVISTAAQVNPYAFRGNAGDVVQFSVYGQPGTPLYFNAVASIFNPNGVLIAGCTNGPTPLITLTNTGQFTVAVYADTLANVGTYGMSVVPLATAPAPVGQAIGLTNRAADLVIWGQLGNVITVQYATNLAATNFWFPLTNLNLSWSPCRFVDWRSTNVGSRFYRQVQTQ